MNLLFYLTSVAVALKASAYAITSDARASAQDEGRVMVPSLLRNDTQLVELKARQVLTPNNYVAVKQLTIAGRKAVVTSTAITLQYSGRLYDALSPQEVASAIGGNIIAWYRQKYGTLVTFVPTVYYDARNTITIIFKAVQYEQVINYAKVVVRARAIADYWGVGTVISNFEPTNNGGVRRRDDVTREPTGGPDEFFGQEAQEIQDIISVLNEAGSVQVVTASNVTAEAELIRRFAFLGEDGAGDLESLALNATDQGLARRATTCGWADLRGYKVDQHVQKTTSNYQC